MPKIRRFIIIQERQVEVTASTIAEAHAVAGKIFAGEDKRTEIIEKSVLIQEVS